MRELTERQRDQAFVDCQRLEYEQRANDNPHRMFTITDPTAVANYSALLFADAQRGAPGRDL